MSQLKTKSTKRVSSLFPSLENNDYCIFWIKEGEHKIDWTWNFLGTSKQSCSNLFPGNVEENDEVEVDSSRADLETSGKQLQTIHLITWLYLPSYKILWYKSYRKHFYFNSELLPLPNGWTKWKNDEGQIIYIDNVTMKFQWKRPTNGKFL